VRWATKELAATFFFIIISTAFALFTLGAGEFFRELCVTFKRSGTVHRRIIAGEPKKN